MEITDETVEEGLNAVAQMVFPFRALENQKQWMRRRMRKSKELSIRNVVAAVGRLNNSLPVFPNGKELDKFTPQDPRDIGIVHLRKLENQIRLRWICPNGIH
jgi:hypothetical protein